MLESQQAGTVAPSPAVHHDPSLRVIAALVAGKSLLAMSLAVGLELLGPLRMRQWIDKLIAHFHMNPDSGFLALLSDQISSQSVHVAAAAIVAYAMLHGAEAFGLWFDQSWASLFGCIGAAIYVPFESIALWQHRHWFPATVLLVNVFVVLILARNIRNLRARRAARAC